MYRLAPLLLLASVAHGAVPAWSTLSATDGYKDIATRNTDMGEIDVKVKYVDKIPCVQATTTVDLAAAKMLAVADDVESSVAWSSADLVLSEELARTSDAVEFVQLLDVPNWTLVVDRYWMLRGQSITEADGTLRFRWTKVSAASYTSKREELATRGKVIEPPINYGEWVFEPAGTGTFVTYRACADIGGSIPTNIQRWVATRTVPDTVADLVREAKSRQ